MAHITVHPRKQTWNLKITHLKRKNIFHPPSFLGSMLNFGGVSLQARIHGAKVGDSPAAGSLPTVTGKPSWRGFTAEWVPYIAVLGPLKNE